MSIATLMAEACGNGRGVQMKAVCVSDQKSVLALRLLGPWMTISLRSLLMCCDLNMNRANPSL